MKTGRLRLALIAVVATAACAGALLVTLGDTGGHQPVNGATNASHQPQVPHGTRTAIPVADGPLIPKSGAYIGAYVQPSQYTPTAQIDAVRSFEHQLGHRLGIVHVYHPWASAFPSAADVYFAHSGGALLISWGGTPDTRAIIAGRYNALIRARAEAVKRLHRPILLEFRHEMDRPNLRWAMHSPADYIAAWDHIRAIFTAAGANNVGWVWCPTAAGFATGRAQAFYPGNHAVNWVCADAYSDSPSQPLATVAAAFLSWASHHPKPALIGEFGVRSDPAGWATWLAGVGRLARQDTQIKALAYFDADGRNSQGMTYAFSLTGHPAARSAFASLLAAPYFSQRRSPPAGGN